MKRSLKICCLADTHIPDRADNLEEIIERIKEYNVDYIFHAGDLTSYDVFEELNKIAKTYAVRGNMDYFYGLDNLPVKQRVEIGKFKFLIFHGSGIYPRGDELQLYYKTKEENCNVIVTGHTHKPVFKKYKDIYIVNPGSTGDPRYIYASFMILYIEGDELRNELVILD